MYFLVGRLSSRKRAPPAENSRAPRLTPLDVLRRTAVRATSFRSQALPTTRGHASHEHVIRESTLVNVEFGGKFEGCG